MGNAENKIASYGYRIIKVAPGSPAQKAGLIEFLDYIIEFSSTNDQTAMSGNYNDFFKTVSSNEDQETTMKVYNILFRKTRIVKIIPSKKWENADSLLGALVRYEEYATAYERVLRIAKVYPNSPASLAGLQPDTDFLLGSPQYLYTDLNELATFIEMTQEKETIKSLEIYLYNSETNSVRSTLIIPNKNWGGSGYLGCEFGLGILNHLPFKEENMFVSSLSEENHGGSSGSVDRLDDDDSKEEIHHVGSNGETEIMPSKKEEIPEFKLRPPTDTELDQKKNTGEHDLSNEATSQRMRLLHLSHQHKANPKSASKPFIKSGRSTANPFHNATDSSANQEGEGMLSSFNASESRETQDTSADLSKENIKPRDENIIEPSQGGNEKIPHNKGEQENFQERKSSSLIEAERPQTQTSEEVNKSAIRKESMEVNRASSNKSAEKKDVRKPSLEFRENGALASGGVIQEKQAYKQTFEYSFFSKKLSGDYKIVSTNLFDVEGLAQLG